MRKKIKQLTGALAVVMQRVVRWLGEHNGWRVVMIEPTTRRKITLTTRGMTREELYKEEQSAVAMVVAGIINDLGPDGSVGITITTVSRKPRLI